LLLSSDVHSNPGPIRSFSNLVRNATVSFSSLNNSTYYLSLIVSAFADDDNGYDITFSTPTAPSGNITVRIANKATYAYPPILLGSLPNISFRIAQTSGVSPARFNFTLFSVPTPSEITPVSIVTPTVFPITGQVSIVNPVPSVIPTILNDLKIIDVPN
jgi:hypothetical protein